MGKKLSKISHANDIIHFAGDPAFEKANLAVFTNTTNDPTQGRHHDGVHIRTLWGEIAYQLGGKKAYDIIKANDENRTAPKGLFKKILEMTQPALILIDELADYCVAASGVDVGSSSLADQTVSFIQEISEAVASTDKCVLVATLPASVAEVANSEQASQILSSLTNRLSRVGADTKPVADEEIFEVIRRRLFENLGEDDLIENVISAYVKLYQDHKTELPSQAVKAEYKLRLQKSYPFHPELIDMFRIRWASNHDFQRTRGVLRLLASIVADLWKRQGSLVSTNALIHTSDVNFSNLDALSGQLKKLYGNGYDAVISADVSGTSSNSFNIDSDKNEYGQHNLTQGLASTILLGSFGGAQANKGLGIDEIKLCVLKPDSFNHNSVNGALTDFESRGHYLYYSSLESNKKRYWFHTKPNINILINQAKNEVNTDEIDNEILKRLKDKTGNITNFNVLIDPSDDIPEQRRPTLVILGPKHIANPDEVNGKTRPVIEKLATKKGNSERIYRNTMLFLICSEIGINKLGNRIKDYLACKKIRDEYKGQLESEQKEDIQRKIDEFTKEINTALVNAYSIIVKYTGKDSIEKLIIKQFKDSIDLQINANITQLLKDEEWLLESVGLSLLKRNNLLPEVNKPVKVQDVFETFIRFNDKPMITGREAVQNSLERYCRNGEIAIASGDGAIFNSVYYKEGVPGFSVDDDTFWIVDKSLYKPVEEPEPGESPKPEPEPDTAGGKDPGTSEKEFKSVTISGMVDVANYSQVFSSFITPLVANNIKIEIKIKGSTTKTNPLTESSTQYKIVKESAKQLGLKFEVEE